jgi:hypothetical protein
MGITPVKECTMAKAQKKSNKEVRKPKADLRPRGVRVTLAK